MSNKRKTSKDYRAELLDLRNKETQVKNNIIKRANQLISSYPDVPIEGFFLKDYGTNDGYTVSTGLQIIEAVEKHLAKLHPHKQTTIDYSAAPEDGKILVVNCGLIDNSVVCNCDARDMPVYKDQGKYWCPQCGYEVR